MSPYTHKLLRLRHLRRAGFPLRADDLTLEEWMDLGRLDDALANVPATPAPVYLVKMER